MVYTLLSNDKILASAGTKTFADDKQIVPQMNISDFDTIEKQYFLLFPQCFQNTFFFSELLKVGIVR